MPRTKIDFYQSRRDAAAALASLRDIGLNPGDIGGAWLAAEDPLDDASAHGPVQVTDVEEVGRVRFSGWLAEAAQRVAGGARAAPLSTILADLTDAADAQRVRDTLVAGGGIVGVRARDVFNTETD